MARLIPVYLEIGEKRVFACAVEWPGWARSAKDDALALQALVDYGPRYAKAIGAAGGAFTAPEGTDDLEVVERVKGSATTDFGAPGSEPKADGRQVKPADLERLTAVLEASWRALDRSVKRAGSRELRTGPRGGGRDTPKIVAHVTDAESSYLGQLGSRGPRTSESGDGAAATAWRQAMVTALGAAARGEPFAEPRNTKNPWSPRYFVRRTAWHALDHAWEIEDRLGP